MNRRLQGRCHCEKNKAKRNFSTQSRFSQKLKRLLHLFLARNDKRRKNTLKLLTALCLFSFAFSGASSNWPSHTAVPLFKGQKEIWMFQPFRIGIGGNSEISSHPIAFFVMPNFAIKHRWISGKWQIATRHSLNYPTPLLRLGRGFIQPSTAEVPHIITNDHQILITKRIGKPFFTLKIGVQTALRFGNSADFQNFDLPILTPRTAVFSENPTFYWGIDAITRLSPKFILICDLDHFITARDDAKLALESKTMIVWKKSHKFSVIGGVKLSVGNYPWGDEFQMVPLVDLVWKFKKRGDKGKNRKRNY